MPRSMLEIAHYIMFLSPRLKFMFSKKATKIDEVFTVDLILCSKCQIDGEDFVNFCGLLRKHELYKIVLGKYKFYGHYFVKKI